MAVGGRIKPDVTAPGFFIFSANSNAAGDCPITEMAGTAQAMAVTAGAVALIRQYFREGFYPSGERGKDLGGNNFEGGIIPSGALMKAMTISAAQVMPGVFPQPPGTAGQALNGYPNQYSGYGRVQLNQVLFAKENGRTAGGRLFLIDGETVATGEEKVYTIPTRGDDEGFGTEFKVVLVWTDPPAEPISQNPLVNNLDLEVDGQNGNSDGGGGAPDTVNNVEAVRIANTNSETVEVKVKGTSVVEGGPQKFALVVTGPLQLTSPPPAPRQSPPPRPPSSPSPPPPAAPMPMICLDTCGTAGDSVCQDGGWAAQGNWCEFGTDCADCGSRLLLDRPPGPPSCPPPPPPSPCGSGNGGGGGGGEGGGGDRGEGGGERGGEVMASGSGAKSAQGNDLGLAIGLSFVGGLLVGGLAVAAFVWYRKRGMQQLPPSLSIGEREPAPKI